MAYVASARVAVLYVIKPISASNVKKAFTLMKGQACASNAQATA